MVEVKTKDIGDVKDRVCSGEFKWRLEDGCEDYIKREFGVYG
jgi:hypothetical protein